MPLTTTINVPETNDSPPQPFLHMMQDQLVIGTQAIVVLGTPLVSIYWTFIQCMSAVETLAQRLDISFTEQEEPTYGEEIGIEHFGF